MSIENVGKFKKASSKSTVDGVQHLVLTLQEGKLVICLCESLRAFLQDRTMVGGGVLSHATIKIPAILKIMIPKDGMMMIPMTTSWE